MLGEGPCSKAKHDKPAPAVIRVALAIAGLLALVYAIHASLPGTGRTGILLLPALCALLALALASDGHQAVLKEGDTSVVMLVYSITFGGYVGISSYASTFPPSEYDISAQDAGKWMATLPCAGALLRPVGDLVADRIGGARVLTTLFVVIAGCDLVFWIATPAYHDALLLLIIMSGCFGLGNGATFQLVPNRWHGRTGIMAGVVGTAGGRGRLLFAHRHGYGYGCARDIPTCLWGPDTYQAGCLDTDLHATAPMAELEHLSIRARRSWNMNHLYARVSRVTSRDRSRACSANRAPLHRAS